YLFPRFTSGDTTRKIRDISSEGFRAFFNYNKIAHEHSLLFKPRLLQRIVERARRHVHAQFSRYRHSPSLGAMMKLSMASFHANLKPTVCFKQGNELLDFHAIVYNDTVLRRLTQMTRAARSHGCEAPMAKGPLPTC